MKNTCKRTLALALAVVMLLSVSVIGVSAEETEVALNGGVMTDTVAIYEFWQEAYNGGYMYHGTRDNAYADIDAAYNAGDMNWTRYSESAGYSVFNAREQHEITMGEGIASRAFYGFLLKNPGVGTYDLSLEYAVTNAGSKEVKAFLISQEDLDAAGIEWKYAINNDGNLNTADYGVIDVGTFTCYNAELSDSDYEEKTLNASVTLDSDTVYHLVFSANDLNDDNKSGGEKVYINKLTLEKTSAETGSAVDYDFFQGNNGTTISANLEALNAAWVAETLNWKLEAVFNTSYYGTRGWFYDKGNGVTVMEQQMSANGYIALRIKAPGTGVYNATVNYGTRDRGATAGEIYIWEATQDAYTTTEIDALIKTNQTLSPVATGLNFCNSSYTVGNTAEFSYEFTSNKEYVIAFKATAVSSIVAGHYSILLHSLALTPVAPAVAEIKSPEGAEINFTGYANSSTLYSNKAAMDAAYAAGAAWNFEMCENPAYYFEGGRSYFKDAVAGVEQWMGTAGFLALRIKSPVSGEYDVTLSHGTSTRGATGGEFHLIPAPNAAYTDAEIEELMANSTAVATTNFTGGTITNNNLVYGDVKTLESFRYTFTAGQEYLLIAKVTEGTALSTAAGGTANYGYLYMSGIELTPVVSYKSAGKYDTLRAAIKAAEEANEGATVTMLADAELVNLGVTCNIDLNGKTLTVYGDMTTVATVSDSSKGNTGILKVIGDMILAGDQAQLPLYDAVAGGYGLYSFAWGKNNQSEAVANNANARKFWFQLSFDNAKAYALIASGTSGLSIGIDMKWGDGEDDCASCVFVDKTDKTAAAFAAGWGAFMQTAENPWLYVTVQNAVEGMTVTPVIEANGAQVACASIAY